MIQKIIIITIFCLSIICIQAYAEDSTKTDSKLLTWIKGTPDSPYKLGWGLDISMASTSLSLQLLSKAIKSNYVEYTPEELSQFSKYDVNAFDRSAIGPIVDGYDKWSYVTNGLAVHYVWLLLFGKESRQDFTKVIVMYCQAYLMFPLATQWTQPLISRKRPYFYSEEENLETRLAAKAQTSFLSGHGNYGFCFAVLFSSLFTTYYPESSWRYVIWPVSLGTASATCILRYYGHMHYPTDLLASAVSGSLIGWFVHFSHRKREKRKVSLEPIIGRHVGVRLRVLLTDR